MRMILIIMIPRPVSRRPVDKPRRVGPFATRMRKGLHLGAWLAGLALSLPVIPSLAHDDEALHAICPEHGELMHVAPANPKEGSLTDSWSAGSESSEHEHCGLAWSLRERAAVSETETAPVWPSSGLVAAKLVAARVGLSPLHYAPKSSPPAQS